MFHSIVTSLALGLGSSYELDDFSDSSDRTFDLACNAKLSFQNRFISLDTLCHFDACVWSFKLMCKKGQWKKPSFVFLVTFGDELMKILLNICLHFAKQDGQDGKNRKKITQLKWRNTKDQKTKIWDERSNNEFTPCRLCFQIYFAVCWEFFGKIEKHITIAVSRST